MPIEILDTSDGILTARIRGMVKRSDMDELQRAAARRIDDHKKRSFLIIADRFNGWARGGWTDRSFQVHFDTQIKKMAVVCDPKWADQILLCLGQGLRKVTIEHFLPSDLSKARMWLHLVA
jgi:hypothetical protein